MSGSSYVLEGRDADLQQHNGHQIEVTGTLAMSGSGSSGLGLWVARTIAEAHGGSLDLATEPGPGARFRLSLPPASAVG